MIIGIFDFLPAIIGFFVQLVAYRRLQKKYPKGITAKNFARMLQIIAIAISGSILGTLTLNFVSVLTTLLYISILAVNLMLVNFLVKTFELLKPETQKRIDELRPKLFEIFSSFSSTLLVMSAVEWLGPYYLSVESFVKRLKECFGELINHPVAKAIVALLKVIDFLVGVIAYPYIIRPLVLDLTIYVLKFIEKWIYWLNENILERLLGEIITKIVQFISVFSISIPRFLFEIIRNILDILFKKR